MWKLFYIQPEARRLNDHTFHTKQKKDTGYFKVAPTYIETEFILYGKINEEGGNNPNFHLLTKEYGKLVISATEQQLLQGEKRLFKVYGVRAKGKQNLADGKPYDLKLTDYITYNPNYDEHKLDLLIERASAKWNTIPNVDVWLNQIRGGANGQYFTGHFLLYSVAKKQ